MSTDILARIQAQLHTFSKGQKRIANYILESYDKAAFMTASKLGKTVAVSESTVVRFAVELGFDGYPSMQRSLQEMVRTRLTSVQRIEAANDRFGDQDVVSSVLQSDIDSIRLTAESLDRREMAACVEAILQAKHIYIVGVRSSAALAAYLNFYFRNLFDALLRPDGQGHAVRARPAGHRARHHRQAGCPGGQICRPRARREERHGVSGRLARRGDERHQRPRRLDWAEPGAAPDADL